MVALVHCPSHLSQPELSASSYPPQRHDVSCDYIRPSLGDSLNVAVSDSGLWLSARPRVRLSVVLLSSRLHGEYISVRAIFRKLTKFTLHKILVLSVCRPHP